MAEEESKPAGFIGTHEGQITPGGKVILPEDLRSKLGDEVVVSAWFEGCLLVCTPEVWEKYRQGITRTDVDNETRRQNRILLAAGYTQITFDQGGQLYVPYKLRNYASLGMNPNQR